MPPGRGGGAETVARGVLPGSGGSPEPAGRDGAYGKETTVEGTVEVPDGTVEAPVSLMTCA
ncbi:hypothetical protein SAVIM338S_06420 [Streptomyces avidinii]